MCGARFASATGTELSGAVTVLAAASLIQSFEKAHPSLRIEMYYGASATIRQQVNQGARIPAPTVAAPTDGAHDRR